MSTRYNTGNPVGSADPRGLYDTATVADSLVNGSSESYPDRLGVARRSWKSVEDQAAQQSSEFSADQSAREQIFSDFLASSGYQFIGDYAAGIEVTAYNQVIRGGGEFWRAAAGTTLPYTTTGDGMPEGGAFVNIGDGLLRQDLVQPVATFNNVADMVASGGLDVGRKVRTLGYYTPGDGGGNDYEIVAAGTGTDDGGSFIDLSGGGLQAKGLFDGKYPTVEQFGAIADHDRGTTTDTDNYAAFSACANYALALRTFWIVPKRERMFRISQKLTIDLTTDVESYFGGLLCMGEIFSDVAGDFAIHVAGKQIEGLYQNRYPIKGLRLFSDYTSRGVWLERVDHEASDNWYIEGVNAPWVRLTDLREAGMRQIVMKYCGKTEGHYGIEFFETDAVGSNSGVMDATNLVNLESWFAVYCAGNYVGVLDTNSINNVRTVNFVNSTLHYLDFNPSDKPLVISDDDTLIDLNTDCQIVWSGGLIRKGVSAGGDCIRVSNEAKLKITGSAELSGNGIGLNYLSNKNINNKIEIGNDVMFTPNNGTLYTGLEPLFLNTLPNKCGNSDLLTQKWNDAGSCAGWNTSGGTLARNGNKTATLSASESACFTASTFYDLNGVGSISATVEVQSTNTSHNLTIYAFDVLNQVIGGPYSSASTSGSGEYEALFLSVNLPQNTAHCEVRIGNALGGGQTLTFRKPRFTVGKMVSAYSETAYNQRMVKQPLGAISGDATSSVNASIGNEIFSLSATPSFGNYRNWHVTQTDKNQISLTATAEAAGITDAQFYVLVNTL